MADPGSVTRLLDAVSSGEAGAADRLLELVYQELRRIAAGRMRSERPDHTLQATALVHEAYLRLMGDSSPQWANRAHFFGAAGEAMRRILVERARRRGRLRHGGDRARVGIDLEGLAGAGENPDLIAPDLIAIDEALARFERIDPRRAELVKLRYFAGLTLEQAAEVQGISRATADRHWAYARAWLFEAIRGE